MNFLVKKKQFRPPIFQDPAHNGPSSRPLYPRFPSPLPPIPHPLPPIPHPLSPYPRPPPVHPLYYIHARVHTVHAGVYILPPLTVLCLQKTKDNLKHTDCAHMTIIN